MLPINLMSAAEWSHHIGVPLCPTNMVAGKQPKHQELTLNRPLSFFRYRTGTSLQLRHGCREVLRQMTLIVTDNSLFNNEPHQEPIIW